MSIGIKNQSATTQTSVKIAGQKIVIPAASAKGDTVSVGADKPAVIKLVKEAIKSHPHLQCVRMNATKKAVVPAKSVGAKAIPDKKEKPAANATAPKKVTSKKTTTPKKK